MTHEDYVTLEHGKELKRLGFDWKCGLAMSLVDMEYTCYRGTDAQHVEKVMRGDFLDPEEAEYRVTGYEEIDGFMFPTYDEHEDFSQFYVMAPTLNQAATWLRDKYHLAVIVKLNGLRTMWFSEVWTMATNGPVYNEPGVLFESYEEALSNGISKALQLLADKEQ